MSAPPPDETLSEEAKKKRENAERDQALSKDVMAKVSALVRASKGLPRRGDDFELCNSFSVFNNFMKTQEVRLQSLIARVMETAGSPLRPAKVGSSVDEQVSRIVNASDFLVERMGMLMDDLERAGRDEEVQVPKAIIGAESTKQLAARSYVPFSSLATPLPDDLAVRLKSARDRQQEFLRSQTATVKPQIEFKLTEFVENSREPFISKLKVKHHPRDETRKGLTIIDADAQDRTGWTGSDCDQGHPYRIELDHFTPPADQLNSVTPQKYRSLEETTLTLVNTVQGLRKLRDNLNAETAFAVDLEHNDARSFLGITCLIQVSTRSTDYVIDPFPIWGELHILNEPFTNPKILKVFHGAESDIQWLQRDFGIHVVNMFDTYHAMRRLEFPKFSLQFLVQKYCDVTLNKQYQTSDWRIRPLLQEQVEYARCDTHYLLYCHDLLREELLEKGNEVKNLLTTVYNDSALVCGRAYEKPVFDPQGYEPMLSAKRTFNSRQVYALRELWTWRDSIARKEDEGIHYVLPNHMMLYIAEALPREVQGIAACCNPVPELVKQYVMEIHKIVYAARDQPLMLGFVQKKSEGSTGLLQTIIDEQNRMTKLKSILRCKLDFSHTRFDEEIGRLNVSDENDVKTKPLAKSLLGFMDDAEDKDTIAVKQANVVDYAVRDKIISDMNRWATPFECYTIGVKIAEKREAERKAEEERKRKENGEGEKKTFSHHDPSAARPATQQMQVNVDNITLAEAPKERFTEDQILTKKALAKKRKHVRKAADIKFGEAPGGAAEEDEEGPTPFAKEEVEDDDGPAQYTKEEVEDNEETASPAKKKTKKVANVDYSTYDKNMFNNMKESQDAFDPFHQKFRVENKKNLKRKGGKGNFTRTGTMTTGYNPDAKKNKK